MSKPHIAVTHDELLRDYAGYEFIQEEMSALISRFLSLYLQDILALYNITGPFTALEAFAAGAGASKFVFGIRMYADTGNRLFGLRLYNSKAAMKDRDKIYDRAEDYRVGLETHDQPLLEALVDEMRVYEEMKTPGAQIGIDVRKNWIRFPIQKSYYTDTPYATYLDRFNYLEDPELKRLMVNLGLNAFTVGGFVPGYDGKKILHRPEFGIAQKQNAITHISNVMLRIWLDTAHPHTNDEYLGRTIVDLKPAQFVVQTDVPLDDFYEPAVIIDVGPAEHTANIYTYFKSLVYMKKLIPAFTNEMLGQAGFPANILTAVRQKVRRQITARLGQHHEAGPYSQQLTVKDFARLVDEFIRTFRDD